MSVLGISVEARDLNFDLVFPIKDEVSAWLMCLKAEALCEAGIIDTDAKMRPNRFSKPPAGTVGTAPMRRLVVRAPPASGGGSALGSCCGGEACG